MLPINPAKIPAMYDEALGLLNRGELTQARSLFLQINATNSKIAEVHFQLGSIAFRRQNYADATERLFRATELRPGALAVWNALCEALIRLDDKKTSARAAKALAAAPLTGAQKKQLSERIMATRGRTKVNMGALNPKTIEGVIELMNRRAFAEAQAQVKTLLRAHPKMAILHNMAGTIAGELAQTQEAEAAFSRALEIDPDYGEAWNQMGRLKMRLGEIDEALIAFERALSVTPASEDILINLASAYLEKNSTHLALEYANKACRKNSKNGHAVFVRGLIYASISEHSAALRDLRCAKRLGLLDIRADVDIAKSLNAMGESDAAIAGLEVAIKKHPNAMALHRTLASVYQSLGAFDKATEAYRDAIKIAPENGSNYRELSASYRFRPEDPLIDDLRAAWAREDLKNTDRIALGYALSKAMEDTKNYREVFGFLDVANALSREEFPFDIKTRRAEVDAVKAAFAGFTPHAHPLTRDEEDYAPIFVTGMPRSGTTLVEQIISSHSIVSGAGELGKFSRLAFQAVTHPNKTVHIDDLTPENMREIATAYKTYVKETLPEAGRITDKSIQTYLCMGLVWLALPKARVIVVRRDARDNLLSIYKNSFREGTHLYSNSLSDLGAYYRMFVETIDFWREIAPERIYEVQYEDLISDPETQSRSLIAAAGLEWEDACLNFHENKRQVNTLSVYQVRQPMYKSSMAAWKRYEHELEPLIEALGDAI